MPDKNFNRSIFKLTFIIISEFLIKYVINHIAHNMRNRAELVMHCFGQYCESVTLVFDIFAACDASHLDIHLAEISYNSVVYNSRLYTKKLRSSANYGSSNIPTLILGIF